MLIIMILIATIPMSPTIAIAIVSDFEQLFHPPVWAPGACIASAEG